MNKYIVNEQNVKLTGRGMYDEDDIYWCALSGSGFECRFRGRSLTITLVGDRAAEIPGNDGNWARYAVYVNGIRTTEGVLDNFCTIKKIPVINSHNEIGADIKFIKISECAMSTIGICPLECDGEVTPLPAKPLKLEFIGDSITCGYGVDVDDPAIPFKTATEDFTKSYAYQTAKLLDADIRAFSISGWGIISGYTEDDTPHTDQLIPPYYKKLGFSYEKFDDRDGLAPQDIDHDFSSYVPDIIVINLGTNDSSYCAGKEERFLRYSEEYTKFLHTVHECNPTAKILCCVGIMKDDICPYMEKAAADFKQQSGYNEVYTMRFKPHTDADGYGADWHPSPSTHMRSAKLLAEMIKSIVS